MARINYESLVNGTRLSADFGEYRIISYDGKDEKKVHWYTVKFTNSGNEYPVRYTNLNEKLKDLKILKANKQRVKAIQIKQRNRLTKEKQREYKRFDFTGKKVLALDLSSTSTGFAVICNNSIIDFGSWTFIAQKTKKEVEVLKSILSTQTYPNEQTLDERLRMTYKAITELLDRYNVDVVVVEDVFLGMNVTVLRVLMSLQGFILGTCLVRGIEFEKIMPSSWQQWHGLSTIREEIKAESIKKAEMVVKQKVYEDTADAINLGIYAVKVLQK